MSFLVNLIPASARRWLYAILAALVAIYGIWQATEGDWTQFVVSLITSLVSALAAGNTVPTGTEAQKL